MFTKAVQREKRQLLKKYLVKRTSQNYTKFLLFYPRATVAAQENGMGVLNGMGALRPPGYAFWSCLMAREDRAKFLFRYPGLLRVIRPALGV